MQSTRTVGSKKPMEMDLRENEKLDHKPRVSESFPAVLDPSYQTVDPEWITIISLSDTHNQQRHLPVLPKADILIHSGDFTFFGQGFSKFSQYLAEQKHIKWKIVISGNHEYPLDYTSTLNFIDKGMTENRFKQSRRQKISQITKTGAIYLENSGVQILGYNIYGTPYTLQYRRYKHAFQHQEEDIEQEWDKIPSDTDILVSHTPALHILDKNAKDIHGGDIHLLRHITERVNPILHQFGHIHDAFGIHLRDNKTLHVNAAQADSLCPVLIKLPRKKHGHKAYVTYIT